MVGGVEVALVSMGWICQGSGFDCWVRCLVEGPTAASLSVDGFATGLVLGVGTAEASVSVDRYTWLMFYSMVAWSVGARWLWL